MTKHSVGAALPKGLSLFLCFSLACPASLWANPVGGVVAGGAADIIYGGVSTVIEQTTDRAIIDWDSFSIAGGEITTFQHALGSSFAVLNRVTGPQSVIDGTIVGNGNVFLINPNGILVGASGVINTNGFVASTLDLNNAAFMGGSQFTFTGPSLSGVQNDGSITAGLGDVVLIGQTVSNTGTIAAPNGTAALAAGSEVLYKPLDEERVFVQAGVANGDATGVDQTGIIQAAAAELKAAGGNVYSLAINNSGAINADQALTVGGRIYLTAASGLDRGAVSNSGTLATTKGAFGGEVRISGDRVTIESLSSIAAADLQVTGATKILLNGDLSTNGSQTYNGPVVIGDYVTVYTALGDLTFNGTVDSWDYGGTSEEYGLSLQADNGSISFDGAVGGLYELEYLDVLASGGGIVPMELGPMVAGPPAGQIRLNADVTTSDRQDYYGALDVGADAALNAGGSVYFGGTVDSANLSALTVNAFASIDFADTVGATSLGGLTVDAGAISFSAAVHTTGAQTYNGAVSYFPGDGMSDASFTSDGGAISFLGALGTNGFGLSVDAGAGDVRWDGVLSGGDVLLRGTNLIMNGDVNSTGANGVVLVAANSFDNTSASAMTPGPAARWLVYSDDAALDVAGGLTGESEQGVSYPDAPAFAGNGFLYASAAASDAPPEAAVATELDNIEASMVPPAVDVSGGGGESMVIDGAAEAAPGEFGSDDGGSDGGASGDSESGDKEKEKDGDK